MSTWHSMTGADVVDGEVITEEFGDNVVDNLNYLKGLVGQLYSVRQSADVTLLTSSSLLLLNLPFTVVNGGAYMNVNAAFEFNANGTTGNGLMVGEVVLDGTTYGGQALAYNESANTRITVPMVWGFAPGLLAAGSHNVGLRAYKLGGSGSALAGSFTTMNVTLQDGPG